MMRVLAVGCHPDDLEILCGGTLARYVHAGHEVVMAHVTNGNLGHKTIPSRELGRIREKEAFDSAGLIGATCVTLGVGDAKVYSEDPDLRNNMTELIRAAAPDVIITHFPEDYHPDHVATSRLVIDASFLATVPQIRTEHEALSSVLPIYFMDTLAGFGFEADDYVDISAEIDLKEAMIRSHQSQITWMEEHDATDIATMARKVAAFRGVQCGVEYAEAFRRYRAWPRITPGRLLP